MLVNAKNMLDIALKNHYAVAQININNFNFVGNTESIDSFYLENKSKLCTGQCKYILKRIAAMAGSQLGTLLLFDVNKENKHRVQEFIQKIKSVDHELYSLFKQAKTIKILIYSNYILYPLVAKKFRKKRENA